MAVANSSLLGRSALVTGASRGIGRAAAIALAQAGARVTAVARPSAWLTSLDAELKALAPGSTTCVLDLEAPGSVAQLRAALDDQAPDIVVHNLGGTLGITDPFCSADDFKRVMRFNFDIAVELNLWLLPALAKRGWGRVVHVSSISAMENHGPIPYCAAKAALVAYTRSMAGVVARNGVVLSAVLPGAVTTEEGYWETAARERPADVEKFLRDRQRIGRFGSPVEIAAAIRFLCSDEASFFVGSIVPIDGGQGRGYFGQ